LYKEALIKALAKNELLSIQNNSLVTLIIFGINSKMSEAHIEDE